jgi:hypothetical protein
MFMAPEIIGAHPEAKAPMQVRDARDARDVRWILGCTMVLAFI